MTASIVRQGLPPGRCRSILARTPARRPATRSARVDRPPQRKGRAATGTWSSVLALRQAPLPPPFREASQFPAPVRWCSSGSVRLQAWVSGCPEVNSRIVSFLRDTRGSAIELGIGSVVVFAILVLSFDLYSRINAQTTALRIAATMADFVSRDEAPDLARMRSLGQFLHDHELRAPGSMVFVVSAFHRPTIDDPTQLLWSNDSIRIGDPDTTRDIAVSCPGQVDSDDNPDLAAGFAMDPGETLIVVEVCMRLSMQGSFTGKFVAGDLYGLYAVPARATGVAAPA